MITNHLINTIINTDHHFPFQKSLGQQYLQKYQELRRQRQPLVFPRSGYGQRLPDDVVVYDKDPDGSFGHGYTEEAARFEPSAAVEGPTTIDYEYFDAGPQIGSTRPDSAYDFGVYGRYTRHMTSADRAAAAAASAAPTTEEKGQLSPSVPSFSIILIVLIVY